MPCKNSTTAYPEQVGCTFLLEASFHGVDEDFTSGKKNMFGYRTKAGDGSNMDNVRHLTRDTRPGKVAAMYRMDGYDMKWADPIE